MTIILTKRAFQLPNRDIFYVCNYMHTYVAEQKKAFHKAHTIIQNSQFCYALYDRHPLTTKVTL